MKLSIIILCLSLGVSAFGNGGVFSGPPETVPAVDLEKYLGLWYEIARIPNNFQKQCAAGTTAEYSLLGDGRIQVVNTCYRSDGSLDQAAGVARVVDKQTKSKLKVSFVRFLGGNWFWGPYWIIGLDKNYEWAVVGHPKRRYGWILSRTPEIAPGIRSAIDDLLKRQGYNSDDFIDTLVKK